MPLALLASLLAIASTTVTAGGKVAASTNVIASEATQSDRVDAARLAMTAGLPRIAIIIDDLGYEVIAGHRALELPGDVTFAILPGSPRARQLARHANHHGKEVLVHLPMQAANHDGNTEPAAITLDMSRERFSLAFEHAIAAVPFATGVNNHRGSLLTRHPGHMLWLMEEISERDALFFVDSYTTHHSVALQIAAETGVPALKRDVFLDNDPAPESVAREFERLKQLARKHGSAVAIGHPYEATLTHLEKVLPLLGEEGFELVPVSELLPN